MSKNLTGIELDFNDMSAWDFSGQNLTNADMRLSVLNNANFTDAIVAGARLWHNTFPGRDFAPEQLYSTASYQNKQLQRVDLTETT